MQQSIVNWHYIAQKVNYLTLCLANMNVCGCGQEKIKHFIAGIEPIYVVWDSTCYTTKSLHSRASNFGVITL